MNRNNPEETWKPKHSPWLITLAVLLATFMEVLDTSIANVSLPHIAGSLSATVEESTWVITSYLVSNAIILSAAGWLSRFFGRKKYLLYSVVLFTFSSALCGVAQSLGFLVFARILQGLGGGGLQPIAQAVLLESFPPENRGSAMAAYGMGIVLAPIIGPILGGWITDSYSWRWIFYINIPIGILGIILQQLFLEDPPYLRNAKGVKIDYIGFALLAMGIGTLQLILDKGQQSNWFHSAWIIWGAVVASVCLVSLIFWELRYKNPIINLRILKNRNFAIGTTLMAILGAVLFGSTVILPIFMQNVLKYTASLSGGVMTPRGIGTFFSMLFIGRLVNRVENRLLIGFGFFGLGITYTILSHLNINVLPVDIIWPMLLGGLSMGFIFVPITTLSVATLKQDEIHQATGIYSLMRNIGAGIGVSLLITLQSRWTQVYQKGLIAQVIPNNAMQLLKANGAAEIIAPHTIPNGIHAKILQQAQFLSFLDCFRWLGILCFLFLPLILFFQKSNPRKK